MKELIKEIIDKFGGRLAGSKEEELAQDFIQDKMDEFCDSTTRHRFIAPLVSMHGSLRIFCWLYIFSLIMYLVHLPTAFILASANAILFVGHFVTFGFWLDFLFPKSASSNVLGSIEPEKETKSIIIFAAHMDSTSEYRFWYWFKAAGGVLTAFAGILFVLLPLFYAAHLVCNSVVLSQPFWVRHYWLAFLCLSPSIAVLYWIRNPKVVVEGAQDNLSGVAILMNAGKKLSKKRLLHTRILLASFGSEESGLRGAKAWVARHEHELKTHRTAVINLDGIMRKRDLQILVGEAAPLVEYPAPLIARMKQAFVDCGQPPRAGLLPIGATDAAAFAQKKIDAITIVGQSMTIMDPTYHTRLDTPKHIEEEALQKAREILIRFAINWDCEMDYSNNTSG